MVKRQKKDVYQVITNQVLEALDYAKANNIKLNWTKSWKSGKAISRPLRSVPFGTPYKGINALLLLMSASMNGFDSPYFMTYKQAQEITGLEKPVIKGSKGTMVVFYKQLKREEKTTDSNGVETVQEVGIPMLRTFTVFNACQVEGLPEKFFPSKQDEKELEQNQDSKIDYVEEFFSNQNAKEFESNGGAFYRPSDDSIHMPRFSRFSSSSAAYSVRCHEFLHWTGSDHRLKRGLSAYDRPSYAFEELVAELGAAFLMSDFGLLQEPSEDTIAYLDSWSKCLKENKKAIFKACTLASQGVDFMHDLNEKANNNKAA